MRPVFQNGIETCIKIAYASWSADQLRFWCFYNKVYFLGPKDSFLKKILTYKSSNNKSLSYQNHSINTPHQTQTFLQLETTGLHILDKPLAHMRRFQIMMRVPVGPAVLMARSSVNSSFSVLKSECLRIASRLAASSGLGTLTVKGKINLIMLSKSSLSNKNRWAPIFNHCICLCSHIIGQLNTPHIQRSLNTQFSIHDVHLTCIWLAPLWENQAIILSHLNYTILNKLLWQQQVTWF